MKLNKNCFVKIIETLVEIKKDEDNLNKAFRKFEPDFNYICFGRYESLIVKTLETAMEDTSEWISYWLYELDCGMTWKKGCITDKEGKDIKLKTPEDLYDILNKGY